jgi:hypothetical protein
VVGDETEQGPKVGDLAIGYMHKIKTSGSIGGNSREQRNSQNCSGFVSY